MIDTLECPRLSSNTVPEAGGPWVYSKALVHELVADWAKRTPSGIAVKSQETLLSYAELEQAANALAASLAEVGARPGSRVGVHLERTERNVICLLAIFKSGCVYTPLEYRGPIERLAYVAADAALTCILTDTQGEGHLTPLSLPTLLVDTAVLRGAKDHPPKVSVHSSDAAYLIYTSGSTGRPKGVVTRHAELTNQMLGWERFTPSFAGLSGTLIAPFVFDNSVWEHFFVLCWGGTLHVISDSVRRDPHALVEYLTREQVTSTNIPPILLASVASEYESRPLEHFTLKRLVAGGESVAQATYQRFRALSAGLELIVGYGPTEAAITATVHRFDQADDLSQPVPIGSALPGYRIYLLNELREQVAPGETGEIAIGGEVLADGYLNRPELSAERFVADPFSVRTGAKLYLTGDLARALPNGALLFQGRVDHQVKIRGQRVELEEIESVLMRHPGVQRAVVKAFPQASGDAILAAFVQGSNVDADALREEARRYLPTHMVPSRIVEVQAFQQTASGKVDRKVLELPAAPLSAEARSLDLPVNELQLLTLLDWISVLGHAQLGVRDNFLDVGGSSLLAIRLMALLQRQLGERLPTQELMDSPTIEQFSSVLAQRIHGLDSRLEHALGSRVTLKLPDEIGVGRILLVGTLLRQLSPLWAVCDALPDDAHVVGIRLPLTLQREPLAQQAAFLAAEIASAEARSSVVVAVGYGALVAHQACAILEANGARPPVLVCGYSHLTETDFQPLAGELLAPRSASAEELAAAWTTARQAATPGPLALSSASSDLIAELDERVAQLAAGGLLRLHGPAIFVEEAGRPLRLLRELTASPVSAPFTAGQSTMALRRALGEALAGQAFSAASRRRNSHNATARTEAVSLEVLSPE